jgi:hypothetical protein
MRLSEIAFLGRRAHVDHSLEGIKAPGVTAVSKGFDEFEAIRMAHRVGKITATLVGAALIVIGLGNWRTANGRDGNPEWTIAGAILIAGVLIASAIPQPPRPPRPKPPHPLD